ncbi:DNA topoisomerase [Blyttiomyces helicus]|uniref:DNA topoisomerase (ATP-hydrolyzing) n=1 Tax=Blyttiomyces helicus TaxID=388810 RepID=A0A4P9WNN1_9FUNG|nr:DNA topoisomerase [Blyttiomyces helicus]|eukprot:RKO94741.1 DNA topoisomerase [Blyttiomyces helicus]
MPYINRSHWRRFKRMTQEAQDDQEVTCAATILQLPIILFQTSLRDRHYLTTSYLVDSIHSLWHTMYWHGTNCNLISVIGFDRATFEDLLQVFSRFYIVKGNGGRVEGATLPVDGTAQPLCRLTHTKCLDRSMTGYRHGEQPLCETIIRMAQDYVQSNNIALFSSEGAFGTCMQGGKDAVSPRYIYTKWKRYLF